MSAAMLPNSPPDGRRAGATWVAATGAFLLLASASVFIAVRWDQVPEAAKLGLVGALTGAFLVGGRALRRTLPATGDVLFHLGAFLVPVDVAALGLRLHLGWRALLLAEGVVAAGVLGALAAGTRSVVLRWAAGGAVVVLAGGIAAVSPLPAPLVLAFAAATVTFLGTRRPATFWAAVAGLSPMVGVVVTAAVRSGRGTGAGVLVELGLGGHTAAVAALGTGALAAFVLGREAARRHDLSLVALAGACLTTGAATTWVNAAPPLDAWFLAGPALVLLVEVVAGLCARDTFWARPTRAVALGAEMVAAVVATPVALILLLLAPLIDGGFDLIEPGWTPQPPAGLAWALLAGGALLAAWRRQGPSGPTERAAPRPSGPTERAAPRPSGPTERADVAPLASPLDALRWAVADGRTVSFLALALGAGLVAGTGSTVAVAAGLVVLAMALVAAAAGLEGSRAVAALVTATAAGWAPFVVAASHPLASLPVGLAAAAVLGVAAVAWGRVAGGWLAAGLATAGSLVAFAACATAGGEIGLTAAMLTSLAAAWALAALVGRARPMGGHVVRVTMGMGVVGSLTGSAGQVLVVATVATVLYVLDAVRHDEPLIAVGAGLGAPLVVGAACGVATIPGPTTGLILCAAAAIFAALAVPFPAAWRLPFVVTAAGGVGTGLVLAAGDPVRLAECLLLVGGLAAGAGVLTGNGLVGHVGGAVALLGLAMHLILDGVTASEAFLGPVALQLVVAGWQLRRRADPPSSWVAYGPAVGLLGASALAERLAGGPAWHSLVAGAVGVAAVAVGGWRRLAGPLFLGTGLVAGVTVVESLTTLAGIPTWGWLAIGGTALLTTGVALERSATSPVEAGRRLVDVVEQRFS